MPVTIIPDTGVNNIYVNADTGRALIVNAGPNVLVPDHNALQGKQGGSSNQYYHLTNDEYSNLVTGEVIRPEDTGIFATFDYVNEASGVLQSGIEEITNITGDFYLNSNPSGYITGVDLSDYAEVSYVNDISGVLNDKIENIDIPSGDFYPNNNPSGFINEIPVVTVYELEDLFYETGLNFGDRFYLESNNSFGKFRGDIGESRAGMTITNAEEEYVNGVWFTTEYRDGRWVYYNWELYGLWSEDRSRWEIRTEDQQNDGDLIYYQQGTQGWSYIWAHEITWLRASDDQPSSLITAKNIYANPDAWQYVPTEASDIGAAEEIHFHDDLYYAIDNPSGYITGFNSGDYATIYFVTGVSGVLDERMDIIETSLGDYYLNSNPSGYITGVNLNGYVTGDVIRPSDTGLFYSVFNPSGYASTGVSNNFIEPQYISGSRVGVVANSLDVTGSTYTIGLSDVWNYRRLINSTGCLLILPSGVSWPDDAICYFRRGTSAGGITFSAASGNVVPNDNSVADVPAGGVFAVKKLGSTSNWDFI